MTKPKSGRYPWMKWWTRVWLGDPALRSCSPGARGIWADIVTAIHQEGQDGVLLFKAKRPTTGQLARLTGCTPRQYLAFEHELEEAGVFDRRESDGAIICRKSARDSGADGATEGSPEYDPNETEGSPSGSLNSSDGLPASRGRARANVLPLRSPSSSGDGGAGGSGFRDPPERPSVIDEQLAMHESLDTPEIRQALKDLDEHRVHRRKGRHSAQSLGRLLNAWASKCADQGGSPRFLAAINAALESGLCTPFDKTERVNDQATPANSARAMFGLDNSAKQPRTVDVEARRA